MTPEQIEKYRRLEGEMHSIERSLGWMKRWGEDLYSENGGDRFMLTFTRWESDKVVMQRPIEREVVESEYVAELRRLEDEKRRIEEEIAKL